MKNINLSFDLKSITRSLQKRFSLVLWLVLALLVLAEAWIMKGAVMDKILQANDRTQFAGAQLVKLNLNVHEVIVERLTENSRFAPTDSNTRNPFGIRPPSSQTNLTP